jgi:queuine tRNA-ribosyltransferase
MTEEGVRFRSHIDGTEYFLSPERSVAVQEALGSDIAMVLDECPPAQAPRDDVIAAVERTTRWAKRCQQSASRNDMAWFGIVQGALFEDLRSAHAQELAELDFPGYAIGGVSVGESPEDMQRIVAHTAPLLPPQKPRYLMGVGTPGDLVRGVAAGVDMFDCVMPTRNARNGQLFTSEGRLNIKNRRFRDDPGPLDPSCSCHTCQSFSRAYLRHLFVAGELTYHRLATIHNLAFYLGLMDEMREAIATGNFDAIAFLKRAGEKRSVSA